MFSDCGDNWKPTQKWGNHANSLQREALALNWESNLGLSCWEWTVLTTSQPCCQQWAFRLLRAFVTPFSESQHAVVDHTAFTQCLVKRRWTENSITVTNTHTTYGSHTSHEGPLHCGIGLVSVLKPCRPFFFFFFFFHTHTHKHTLFTLLLHCSRWHLSRFLGDVFWLPPERNV